MQIRYLSYFQFTEPSVEVDVVALNVAEKGVMCVSKLDGLRYSARVWYIRMS